MTFNLIPLLLLVGFDMLSIGLMTYELDTKKFIFFLLGLIFKWALIVWMVW